MLIVFYLLFLKNIHEDKELCLFGSLLILLGLEQYLAIIDAQ